MDNQINQSPLRIYLDTSDYSRFADISHRNEPGLSDILNFLRVKKEQGLVEIRFSGIHLFEFLKDPSQRALALRKVQVMEELCGDRVFRFFSNVFEREREAFRLGVAPASLVVSDEGEWFPSVEYDNPISLDALVRSLSEQLPGMNTAQVRAMIANPEAAAFLNANMPKEFPLSKVYGSDLIQGFLSNSISGDEIARELVKDFAKPSVFIEHYLEGYPKAQELFSILARVEQNFHRALTQTREELKNRMDVLGDNQEVLKRVRQQLKKFRYSDTPSPNPELDELPARLQEAIAQDRFLEERPALSTHCSVLTAYLRDILYPSPVPPEIKESDAGDILHATYLPYVDLYRTDGRFGSLFNKVAKPSTVKVVPKLRQLPEAIEKQLEGRSRGRH